MRKYLSKKIIGLASIGILAIAAIVFAQTQFTEVNDLLFRSQNPQIRSVGTISVRDRLGTAAGSLAAARPAIVTTAATRTLLASECGAVIVANATSGTQVFTLPAINNTGCMFTFIAGDAGTEIQIKTPGVATCAADFLPAGATPVINALTDTSCEGGIKNTGASNVIGDTVTIISDGVRWLGVGLGTGIWAVV